MSDASVGVSALDFLVWVGVVAAVLAIGMGAIAAAYFWPTGKSVVFDQAIAPAPALAPSAQVSFQQGCEALAAKQYRQAIRNFANVIDQDPNCAEAYHNLGLTFANLGDDQAALRNLLRASDLYDQQGDKTGLDTLRSTLETLRSQRKQTAASSKSEP